MSATLRAASALAALTTAILLVGCASPERSEGCPAYSSGVVLVVGVHANQPRPDLTADIVCRLSATVAAEKPIGIVAVDGEPYVVAPTQIREISGGNENARTEDVRRGVAEVVTIVQNARPRTGGADLLTALIVAGEVAHGTAEPIVDVVVVDSGVSDAGIDLTQQGGTLVVASDVTPHLFREHALTPVLFAGLRVEFWGLCATREPQPTLSLRQCDSIRALWPELVAAAGGDSVAVTFPRSGDSLEELPPVGIADVIDPDPYHPEAGATLEFDGASALAFRADTAVLLAPDAARSELASVADWLRDDPTRRAHVVGRTSSADPDRNEALSQERADRCRNLLLELGAAPEQVTAEGVGYTGDPPDRLPDGSLDPIAAAANRVTEIRLS
jgi:hypothetical protein